MRFRHWALVVAGLGLLAGLLLLARVGAIDAVVALFRGTLGSGQASSGTLRETCPLLISGIAVFLALQAGLFNIGVEGQLVVGALAATYAGLQQPGPIGLVLGILAATVGGALWALPAGLIKAYRGGHEVITTIMLNSVAVFVTNGLVAGPLRDPGQQSPTTRILSPNTMLPDIMRTQTLQVSSAILFGLLLLFVLWRWLEGYVAGYELRLVGANSGVARLAGVDPRKTAVWAMAGSGAISGFAGAVQVFGYTGRFYSDFSPGYGFNALGVALLAGESVLAILPAALLFGILAKGSASLQILGIPKGVGYVVLGTLIAVFAAIRYRKITSEEQS